MIAIAANDSEDLKQVASKALADIKAEQLAKDTTPLTATNVEAESPLPKATEKPQARTQARTLTKTERAIAEALAKNSDIIIISEYGYDKNRVYRIVATNYTGNPITMYPVNFSKTNAKNRKRTKNVGAYK